MSRKYVHSYGEDSIIVKTARLYTLVLLSQLSVFVVGQTSYIQVLAKPGTIVTLKGLPADTIMPGSSNLIFPNLKPGYYSLEATYFKQEMQVSIPVYDENERIIYLDPERMYMEDRSPVNRPSKNALANYKKEGIIYIVFTDPRDGQSYRSAKIGDQTWMTENMNFNVENQSFAFPLDTINERIYGKLYTWEGAMQACPPGWHLPSDLDWMKLENYLGISEKNMDVRGWRDTRNNMSVKSSYGWLDCKASSDDLGFSAFPGGYFDEEYIFCCEGYYAYFWTSTEGDSPEAWYRVASFDVNQVGRFCYSKKYGFSVRCVKDTP